MASGTVNFVFQTVNPTSEVIYMNVDDTNTYVSRKFNTIQAASISENTTNASGSVGVAFSGQTATIHGSGLDKSNVTITLWGE